jgi:hypothetical protein
LYIAHLVWLWVVFMFFRNELMVEVLIVF